MSPNIKICVVLKVFLSVSSFLFCLFISNFYYFFYDGLQIPRSIQCIAATTIQRGIVTPNRKASRSSLKPTCRGSWTLLRSHDLYVTNLVLRGKVCDVRNPWAFDSIEPSRSRKKCVMKERGEEGSHSWLPVTSCCNLCGKRSCKWWKREQKGKQRETEAENVWPMLKDRGKGETV